MNTYRAAVIGLPGIGQNPAGQAADPVLGTQAPHSHVAAYAAEPRTTVAAVCDIAPGPVERFRSQWGERFPEAKVYTDYREMLERERPDLLSVVTSDHRHAQ